MVTTAGRLVAAIGAVLAIVGVFLDAFLGSSYWDVDGTLAWMGLALGAAALLLGAAAFARHELDAWLLAVGAVLVGYWAWLPALTAFGAWDDTGAGLWLCLGGALLIAAAAGAALVTSGEARSTAPGVSLATAVTGLGIALVFPGIFLDTERAPADPSAWSYWDPPQYGHSLGILMLVLAAAAAVVFVGTTLGVRTRGLDVVLTLVLLGLVVFDPVWTAFNDLGDLQVGAWLALAGGILAAGGTWSARAGEAPTSEENEIGARLDPGTDQL
jgi:hypothetical protein